MRLLLTFMYKKWRWAKIKKYPPYQRHFLYILLPAVAFCKLSIRELYSVCWYSLASPLSQEGREPVRVDSQNTMSIGGQEYAENLRPLLSPRDQKLSEHYICPPSIYLLPAMGHAQQQLPTTVVHKQWQDQGARTLLKIRICSGALPQNCPRCEKQFSKTMQKLCTMPDIAYVLCCK